MICSTKKLKDVKLASQIILNGGIIIYPTDTLYGLGVDATNTDAINSLNNLKNKKKIYSIILNSKKEIMKYAYIPKGQEKNIHSIFPGPFTAILKNKNSDLSSLVNLNSNTIGIRIPKSNFIKDVVKFCKKPIITTSVNSHGEKSIQDISEIEHKFPYIHIFYDKLKTKSNGSTIIDFSKKYPIILRQGDGEFST